MGTLIRSARPNQKGRGVWIVDCRSTHDASIKKGRHLAAFFITSPWSMKFEPSNQAVQPTPDGTTDC